MNDAAPGWSGGSLKEPRIAGNVQEQTMRSHAPIDDV